MAEPQEKSPPAPESLEKLLDVSGRSALLDLVTRLRADLVREARRLSDGNTIAAEDLEAAYSKFSFSESPDNPAVYAQRIVSRALRENRAAEWVSYAMACILFVFGLVLLALSVLDVAVSTRAGALVSGSILELLVLVPFRFAVNSRRHNIALRMVSYVLSFAQRDSKLAAALLKDTFVSVVLCEPPAPTKKQSR